MPRIIFVVVTEPSTKHLNSRANYFTPIHPISVRVVRTTILTSWLFCLCLCLCLFVSLCLCLFQSCAGSLVVGTLQGCSGLCSHQASAAVQTVPVSTINTWPKGFHYWFTVAQAIQFSLRIKEVVDCPWVQDKVVPNSTSETALHLFLCQQNWDCKYCLWGRQPHKHCVHLKYLAMDKFQVHQHDSRLWPRAFSEIAANKESHSQSSHIELLHWVHAALKIYY